MEKGLEGNKNSHWEQTAGRIQEPVDSGGGSKDGEKGMNSRHCLTVAMVGLGVG